MRRKREALNRFPATILEIEAVSSRLNVKCTMENEAGDVLGWTDHTVEHDDAVDAELNSSVGPRLVQHRKLKG